MYKHILIPTDGSELAERAVTHGLSLAKFVGAKVTVIIVEERLGGWLYTEQIKEHAASVLDRARCRVLVPVSGQHAVRESMPRSPVYVA